MSDGVPSGVLVVEDDPAIRRLVTAVLKREGYRVESAVDGVEAVLKLGQDDYDVIVLDLMMPNLDGFTFIETFAEKAPERLASIIVTSAVAPSRILDKTKGIPLHFLSKPFDIGNLLALVRKVAGQI